VVTFYHCQIFHTAYSHVCFILMWLATQQVSLPALLQTGEWCVALDITMAGASYGTASIHGAYHWLKCHCTCMTMFLLPECLSPSLLVGFLHILLDLIQRSFPLCSALYFCTHQIWIFFLTCKVLSGNFHGIMFTITLYYIVIMLFSPYVGSCDHQGLWFLMGLGTVLTHTRWSQLGYII
jgi:hypothetical protein